MTAHAKAYASLALPAAKPIAELSGITEQPLKARQCLGCHATAADAEDWEKAEGFRLEDGLQCEACHGPGSEYATKEVMSDRNLAMMRGLKMPAKEDCRVCHRAKGSHDRVLATKQFDIEQAWRSIAHPIAKTVRPSVSDFGIKTNLPSSLPPEIVAGSVHGNYKNPLNLALTPDGKELWIACEAAREVAVVDVPTRKWIAAIPVGGQPNDVCFTPDGKRAFVSNRLDDNVSVVEVETRKVLDKLPVGDEPHGVLADRQGKYLYVLNTAIDSISVFDVATLKEVKRLPASRSPWALAQSPDGKSIFVTHALSRFVADRTPSLSEVTVIDAEQAFVKDRFVVPAANLLADVAWHPSGEYAVIPLMRTKNLVPMTRIMQGWTISNGIGLVWRDGTVDQVLLDQNDLCFPDPTSVCITPDGKFALVTSATSARVAVVDLEKLTAMLKTAAPGERARVFPNHLGKPAEFVVKYIKTQPTPWGITCSKDGMTAFVASKLDDSVAVIDLKTMETVGRIDLDATKELTKTRRGEKLFHSANIAFHRQFSCHSCHPDGHIDGLVYDIESDGIGIGPVDNRTLRGINDMAPYKWEGTNPSLKRQCGARLAVFFTRLAPFTADELDDLDYYICTIARPPNRYRNLGEPLTDAQRRGKAMFERARTNDGRTIPVLNRCNTCHAPPLYTDGRVHNVGTKFWYDKAEKFDAPQLQNIYDSAPYLHNGIARTLEEIWTKYNPYDQHGITNDMTKDQLNDLIEYLKTL
jgi:YVTN family beta-propeller protein